MSQMAQDELSVLSTGVQTFKDRFGPDRAWGYDTPHVSMWRCNLTGLSQTHNLYFVAYGQDIHVYEPRFPTQAVTEQPLLIWTSQPSAPGLTGHLDPECPHDINNLVVHLLGTEEVVAVVRDDGDVDVFLIRHVIQAIERRAEPGNTLNVNGHEIRPFFQSNVANSAWGLAIHAEARILATSSNEHEVRVFKFGLLQTDEEGKDEKPIDIDDDGDATHRGTDVFRCILNGFSNIPYISFCNTGDDPQGRWLLTTDISGDCRVMDLQHMKSVQCFRFGRSFAARYDRYDRLNSGWSIMFLDRRSFKQSGSRTRALGLPDDYVFEGSNSGSWEVVDITNGLEQLHKATQPFMYHAVREPRQAQIDVNVRDISEDPISNDAGTYRDDLQMEDAGDDGVQDGDEEEEEEEEDCSDGGVELDMGGHSNQLEPEVASSPMAHASSESVAQEATPEGQHMDDALQDFDATPSIVDDDDASSPDEFNPSYRVYYNGETVVANKPVFTNDEDPLCDDLPCPIMHTSPRNIYLIQPSNQLHATGPRNHPMIGLANPLRQALQEDFAHLRNFDRLNLTAYIPSLGVVVLASQKGRAIVMKLTKFEHRVRGQISREKGRTVYGMCVQAIVPFVEQEKENSRPVAPLHGIAVSPLQGSAAPRGANRSDVREGDVADATMISRWRLLMMYADHSILSYEISRAVKEPGSGVEVEKLIV